MKLGSTDISVSRLCFGTLTMGPLQKRMPEEEGALLLIAAAENGVNFFDTAELYGTYAHLAILLRQYPESVVATKCFAYDEITAEESYSKAAREMGRDHIDIFMLHEQDSEHMLRGHQQALEYFAKQKEKGHIGALGISTHSIAGVRAAIKHPDIEVVEAVINFKGFGIIDGTLSQMEAALAEAAGRGMGVIAMKALGGGHLMREREQAFKYIRKQDCIHSAAIGIQSLRELRYAAACLSGREDELSAEDLPSLEGRRLIIEEWCTGCSKCMDACRQGAMTIVNGKAVVDAEKCVLCGYCGANCPGLYIKVI
ncbi:MAG: aldo/keto reductase [Bacillota bacterium]|nr:aldo/keto reductase [Bacillota bacterium]